MLIAASLCLSAQNTSCSSMDDFECGNGDCIKYTLTCDGMAHCKDKSDEKQSYCSECDILNVHGGYEGLPLLSVCVCVQLTVCVRRAISAVWTDAVSATVPGVTGEMIAGITLMNSSVMVSASVHTHYILNICNAAAWRPLWILQLSDFLMLYSFVFLFLLYYSGCWCFCLLNCKALWFNWCWS